MVVFRQKRLYVERVDVFGQRYCSREKVVVSGKEVVLMHGSCIRAKWLFLGKSGLLGQSGYIWAKWLFSSERGCFRARLLYSGNMVVFGQIRCIPAKVVVLEKEWLYPGRVVVFL